MRLVIAVCIVGLAGCVREMPSEKPPVHVNPNMDSQQRYDAQSASSFFADGATMRTPVPGTVAQGMLHDDAVYYTGLIDTTPVAESPVPVTMALLRRGQDRYNIYCSPCHSRAGDGQGIMIARGYIPPPSFHDERILSVGDGHIFNVITNGIRNMPAYKAQIPVEDRWAIVAYVRALQRSRQGTISDVPPELRGSVK